ncbi:cytochrome c maturation protein CcmE [Sphingomonas cannabina]|uniref:cytochrome c maturation protein CcmE n=1 Tax=Sphingomonas cannabina TaxID=2899123 RepID=UPI001F165CFB|nr:cytochrome c maturation protein CcmE [Sphingomonas cannabina]UIJ44298.1 cytochrome c maturation protein CcmE [Sphingomonas cannabina]
MKAKHQRLTLVLLAVVAVIAAGLLALSALRDQAAFFYAPGDVAKGVPVGKAVRLGGMVEKGSLKRAADGVTQTFVVTDGVAQVPVRFAGIAPDLFREGSGVVAEGSFLADGSFKATNLLAKHDERYMPPEVAGAMHKSKSLAP